MNPRVLELIKNPKNIQLEDLGLLKEEIHAFPYIQNIRALHLYGVHLYEKENYQKELSITAAYTTDKKILYQLINGKIKQEQKPEIAEENQSSQTTEKSASYAPKNKVFPIKREETETSSEKAAEEEITACVLPASQEIKHIYINGERNRILFEGEENFLDEENSETIDIESTLESGTLVTQKVQPAAEPLKVQSEEDLKEIEEETGENFTPETIIHEEDIPSEKEEEEIEKDENLSFHEVEPIVPEVNIEEEIEEEPESKDTAENNETLSKEEESIEESDAEVSFHGTDAFMPDVKIQANSEVIAETAEVSQPNVNKHEEEMRRLIEQVEKKMKEAKPVVQEEKEEPETAEDHEISFAETQSFHFWSTDQENAELKTTENVQEPIQEEIVEAQSTIEEESKEEIVEEGIISEAQTAWKPMNVESNMPDSLISKSAETSAPEVKIPVEEIPVPIAEPVVETIKESEAVAEASNTEILPVVDENPEISTEEDVEELSEITNPEEKTNIEASKDKKEEVPVMNVSFFGTDISTLKVEEKQKENNEEPVEKETVQEVTMKNTTQTSVDSNVPGFINTWQSWLKIDRTDEIEKEKSEIKEKAIETFIENNPRISQLKEESTYVIKEKNDDISHLMTETLANLYFEQKLYTKAIKAFEILIRKTPEKKEYFESKIKDIKDFRSKN
ncbi:hypothetical protein F3J23_17830 [Chryseobacterium sp. Tr-659]|uniref:hypothetical protein n=1 Tax=Chryseobacterium sp. Tr-659 TaxID=2608340 RepID=UPI00141E7BB0|nr:hypothetical protein [Chryseobacterium sp. Tr-659]NIF07283.1 hypothetical protein [Chryseobacterium sp. Tr-659]